MLDRTWTHAQRCNAQAVLAPVYREGGDYAYRSDVKPTFSDPVVGALLSLAPLKRLAGIGFLGAIDYVRHGSGREGHRRRHNRLEHSIGVAHLADTYANEANISEDRRRLLLCASLLHDIGHCPLSHTLEPVFAEEFGLDHHVATDKIIKGDVDLGEDIPELLSNFDVDIEEVLALINGEHDGDVGNLFSRQINLDTLEGISRCRAFVAPSSAFSTPVATVRKWAANGDMLESSFDSFWRLKHDVYNLFICAPKGAVLDVLAQTYMRERISEFSADDFFLTEPALRRRHPRLYELLGLASKGHSDLFREIPLEWKRKTVNLKKRRFFVVEEEHLSDESSIDKRYKQSKTKVSMTLSDLLG